MQTPTATFVAHTDLISRIRTVALRHADAAAELIILLAEARATGAAEAHGYASLFAFCSDELLLSRDQTYRYLACATVYARHPHILPALRLGRLSATGVATLAAYVKANSVADGAAALARAEGLTVEAIERLAAELMPKADVPCVVTQVIAKQAAAQPGMFDAMSGARPNVSSAIAVSEGRETSQSGPIGSEALGGKSRARPEAQAPTQVLSQPRRATTTPLSSSSYKLTMTLSAEAYAQLNELRELSSHAIPHGEIDKVVTRAIAVALADARRAKSKALRRGSDTLDAGQRLGPRRRKVRAGDASTTERGETTAPGGKSLTAHDSAAAAQPRNVETGGDRGPKVSRTEETMRRVDQTLVAEGERYVPAAVQRAVWERDRGCCAFVGANGRRCCSRWQVEIDHVIRVADGGQSTVANTRLCCRRHNQAREKWRASRSGP